MAQENKKISGPSVSVPPLPSLSDINKKVFKVLIAEDNDSNFSLVQHILFKYNLTRVKNGVEALEKIRNEQYDIILMDMKMPIMEDSKRYGKSGNSIPKFRLSP